jgi:hypothetical protein
MAAILLRAIRHCRFVAPLYDQGGRGSGESSASISTEDCVSGQGLYVMAACLRHSCAPNAHVSFEPPSAVLRVVAVRGIAKGEEVTVSMVGATLPYEDRQRQLAEQHLAHRAAKEEKGNDEVKGAQGIGCCRCARCLANIVTSDSGMGAVVGRDGSGESAEEISSVGVADRLLDGLRCCAQQGPKGETLDREAQKEAQKAAVQDWLGRAMERANESQLYGAKTILKQGLASNAGGQVGLHDSHALILSARTLLLTICTAMQDRQGVVEHSRKLVSAYGQLKLPPFPRHANAWYLLGTTLFQQFQSQASQAKSSDEGERKSIGDVCKEAKLALGKAHQLRTCLYGKSNVLTLEVSQTLDRILRAERSWTGKRDGGHNKKKGHKRKGGKKGRKNRR